MTVQNLPPHESLRQHIEEMTRSVSAMGSNIVGARALASTPDGREKMLATQRELRQWAAAMRTGLRQLDKADKVLTKALRGKPWGISL